MGGERWKRKFMNGTVGSDNNAKHGDVGGGRFNGTRPYQRNKIVVLYENTCSDSAGRFPRRGARTRPKATDDIRVQLVNHRGRRHSFPLAHGVRGSGLK